VSDRLLLFTRYPISGQTKTRLLSVLTPPEALAIHRSMTEAVVRKIDLFQQVVSLDVEIRFTGGTIQQMKDWLGDRFVYTDQGDGDLGCRLARGIGDSFLQGYSKVIVIGSDCPSITAADLKRSLDLLDDYDCVLGPAFDGGYYLIGLRVFHPSLFSDITWSSPLVLQQTIEKLKQLNLTWTELRPLGDIDRPEDLVLWLQYRLKTQDLPKISVIIPTLNEEEHIQSTLLSLQDQPVEVIVVDGGSHDKTIEIVGSFPVKVLVTEPHRAKQMNMGAKIATGDILLFLHGDTKVPPDFVSQIMTNLAKPDVVAGAFLLGIDDTKWGLKLVEWGVNLRSKVLELPYGDQGIFLSKQIFNQVGGFPEIAIMEDFVLIKQLQKLGKIAIANTPVQTSARRWQKLGIIKTTLVNQLVILGYYLGVHPDRLRDWYRNVK
jgi:rSAM/selenodomain-associated transferase 2/rSAM/selenodomain-associated transferase 1